MSLKTKTSDLVAHWRDIGVVEWAEGEFGWIGMDGEPIKLSPWQRAVLDAWWDHREHVTTLAISNVKKTGKTFLDALLLAWRWLALPGEHFAVGNDLDQSSGRQFQEIAGMVRRNPYLKKNCKITAKNITFTPTGSTIMALSVDAAGNAGSNHLTASHTEAWGIIYEGGIRAYEELTPPPGKQFGMPALRICDSYAGYEGESVTWHALVDRGMNGERIDEHWPLFLEGGLLLFHADGLWAQENCYRGTPEDAEEYYTEQRATLRPGAYSRLHENKRATGAEIFISLQVWDQCIDPEYRPMMPDRNLVCYAGVDASVKHDSAAVVVCQYDRDLKKVRLVKHRIWQPTVRDPLDIDHTIGDYLRKLKNEFCLQEVRFDPFQMHDVSLRLQRDGIPMVEYPQSTSNLTESSQNLYELIKEGRLILYMDEAMRRAASQAVALQGSRGWRIAKEKSAHKIDVIVSLSMAAIAAVEKGSIRRWLVG